MGSCVSKEATERPNGNTVDSLKRQEQQTALSHAGTKPDTTRQHEKDSDEKHEEPGTMNGQVSKRNTKDEVAKKQDDSGAKEVKVLLLGSGESGKSTIVKQMKILHNKGFTTEELYEYKPFVYKNVMACIKNVINAILDLQPNLVKRPSQEGEDSTDETFVEKSSPDSQEPVLDYAVLKDILDYDVRTSADEAFDPAIAKKIQQVFFTPQVQKFIKYEQGNFYLIDSTQYFMNNLDRISGDDYVPNVDDILRTRKKTSGIFDFKFQSGGLTIHMFDVGGQRSERKKWIHCFDNVTCIIFCVALSEYDQVLLEENGQNRLEESLTLFDSVVNLRWFSRTSIILFLNKIDIFAEKLPYSPLENHFPDYTGGNDINKAAKYILWRFTRENRSGLNIYRHVTQATDTSNIELVFAAVKETILENTLKDSGLL